MGDESFTIYPASYRKELQATIIQEYGVERIRNMAMVLCKSCLCGKIKDKLPLNYPQKPFVVCYHGLLPITSGGNNCCYWLEIREAGQAQP